MTIRLVGSNRSIEPRGLCRDDAAAYIGIGATLFDRLVATGRAPKSRRLEGRVIWDRRQLDRLLDGVFDESDLEDPYANVA
jgi:predicted DNA-binding transcriptional regulator AlpA